MAKAKAAALSGIAGENRSLKIMAKRDDENK
jgi:hypothetical protein